MILITEKCYHYDVNIKAVRKYGLIISISTTSADNPQIAVQLAELCAIDFQTAFEMWEFMLAENQQRLGDSAVCVNLEEKPFGMFNRISESRTRQMLTESLPLIRLIYGQSLSSVAGTNLIFLINLILSGKLDSADEILRCIKLNTTGKFSDRMRTIVDSLFREYCIRNSVKVPVLSRKQSALLLGYVDKVTGPNKKLLTQRIKEVTK